MDLITEELELIRKKRDGLLLPADVVEFARNKDTALHSEFEWDDSIAAERYRLEQAREIIRVRVSVLKTDDEPITVRTYWSLPSDRAASGGYRALPDVLSNAKMRTELEQSAIAEMDSFKRKYQTIRELGRVFVEMDAAKRRILRREITSQQTSKRAASV